MKFGAVPLHVMRTQRGVDIDLWFNKFLTFALYGSDWSVSRLSRFIPGEDPGVLVK
jgi:hypothetical protein